VAGEARDIRAGREPARRGARDLNGRECIVLTALALGGAGGRSVAAPLLKVMQPSIQHLVSQAIATKL